MGLFGKREDCAICGGKVKGLFPWKIDGHLICKECYGEVDVPGNWRWDSIEQFAAYRDFREKNQGLKAGFRVDYKYDPGVFADKPVFDYKNHLFCAVEGLNKTIFKAGELREFTISEDNNMIFHGSERGLEHRESLIPDQVRSMHSLLATYTIDLRRYEMEQERQRREEELAKQRGQEPPRHRYIPRPDLPKPFDHFRLHLVFQHPYWGEMTMSYDAPKFDTDRPSESEYMMDYENQSLEMSHLATALMRSMFPNVPLSATPAAAVSVAAPVAAPAAPAAGGDTAAQLRQFKQLLDDGIISQADFDAKKKQLLGF